jgi:hypothetical protein
VGGGRGESYGKEEGKNERMKEWKPGRPMGLLSLMTLPISMSKRENERISEFGHIFAECRTYYSPEVFYAHVKTEMERSMNLIIDMLRLSYILML